MCVRARFNSMCVVFGKMCLCVFLCACVCVCVTGGTSADLPFFVSIFQAQCIHGTDDGSQGLDGVAVDDGPVLLHVVARETVLMDDPKHTQIHMR